MLIAGNEVDYNTLHELDQLLNRNKELKTVKEKEKSMQEKISSEMNNVHDLQSVRILILLTKIEKDPITARPVYTTTRGVLT